MPEETSPASTPSADGTTASEFEEVFREEIGYIDRRRRAAKQKTGKLDAKPTVANKLVGLAFSGGGIRSATFNLGVLQALRRWSLFKHVDLLSTVSGGGFIGSCLTSLMSGGAGFPFAGATPAVHHLRNNSNYLAPSGLLDYLRMFAVLIRGIILNFLVLVPVLLIPCLIATLVYGPRLLSRLEYEETAERALAHLNSAIIAHRAREQSTLEEEPQPLESPMELESKGGEQVKPLIELLKHRAFVPLAVAKDDLRITAALQERNSSYREVKEPLITGTGSDAAPSTFERGVTVSDVAHRLVDAGLFEPDSKIKEIQIVELVLRNGGLRLGVAENEVDENEVESPLELDHFFEDLGCYLLLPPPKGCKISQQQQHLFMVFVTQDTLVQVLAEKEILKEKDLKNRPGDCAKGDLEYKCWDFVRDDKGQVLYSLTQVLQAFYDARLLDRRWLEVQSSRTLYDHKVAYRWPNDGDSHIEIEEAARALWESLGKLDYSVKDLFDEFKEPSKSKKEAPSLPTAWGEDKRKKKPPPLLQYEEQVNLLAALKAANIITKQETGDPCTRKRPEECEFADATSRLWLPQVLYEGRFYNNKWFEAKFNPEPVVGEEGWPAALQEFKHDLGQWLLAWIEPPYQSHYTRPKSQEDQEIKAAREALSLPPGATVKDLFESIRENRDPCQGVPLFPPAKSCEAEARSKANKKRKLEERLQVQEKRLRVAEKRRETEKNLERRILQALQNAFVVEAGSEACAVESLESCFFQAGSDIESIPPLFYTLQLYNKSWFEDRFKYRKLTPAYGDRDRELRWIKDRVGPAVFGFRKPTVQDLFEFLNDNESLLTESDKGIPIQLAYLRLRTRELIKECPELWTELDNQTECRFTGGIDEALRELYDGKLIKLELSQDAQGASRINELYTGLSRKVEGYFARYRRTRSERIIWNPHELRVPFTSAVAITGLVWVLFFPIVVAVSRALERRGRARTSRMERSFSIFMILIAAVAFLELQPYLIYHWQHLDLSFNWTVIIGLVSLVSTLAAGPALAFFEKFGRQVVILLVSLLGPLLPFFVYLNVLSLIIYSEAWPTRDGYTLNVGYVILFFLLAAIAVHLLLLGLDPNSTSIHEFYRSRLSAAYLVGRHKPGELIPAGDLKLSEMCRAETGAPYHLVNVALNLQGSDDPGYRDRNSDFFLFSKEFVGGGRHSGYCPTVKMEKALPGLDLGTAMAISGAAAAPNMGAFTVGPLVILLALLNIRLGYWLPNPRFARTVEPPEKSGGVRSALRYLKRLPARLLGLHRLGPGPYLFLKELAGKMDDEGHYVNLSDGGHLENTAIFELLRRRCRFIVAGDAEADPKMNFAGLATLARYARIDLDIEIEIDTSALRLEDGASSRHFAIGLIHYPASGDVSAETGYLIYLKASITGDEDQVVSEYRGRQTDFPHQSTADQVFDETQFEAYRALGSHIVDSLFEDLERAKLPEPVLEWLQNPAPASSSTESDA